MAYETTSGGTDSHTSSNFAGRTGHINSHGAHVNDDRDPRRHQTADASTYGGQGAGPRPETK
jgi:hypothetical protein